MKVAIEKVELGIHFRYGTEYLALKSGLDVEFNVILLIHGFGTTEKFLP